MENGGGDDDDAAVKMAMVTDIETTTAVATGADWVTTIMLTGLFIIPLVKFCTDFISLLRLSRIHFLKVANSAILTTSIMNPMKLFIASLILSAARGANVRC